MGAHTKSYKIMIVKVALEVTEQVSILSTTNALIFFLTKSY